MNFQQLRFVREAVRQNMNLTEVANVLYTSQSGVSKQIKDLEDELGVDIFIRRGKRLTGLTEPGKAVHQLIERMLLDAENLRRVARQFADQDSGHLVVATTRWPLSWSANWRATRRRFSASSSIRSISWCTALPGSVSPVSRLPRRMKISTPSSSSRSLICFDTPDCDVYSTFATSVRFMFWRTASRTNRNC